jgi:hypothetical protein
MTHLLIMVLKYLIGSLSKERAQKARTPCFDGAQHDILLGNFRLTKFLKLRKSFKIF